MPETLKKPAEDAGIRKDIDARQEGVRKKAQPFHKKNTGEQAVRIRELQTGITLVNGPLESYPSELFKYHILEGYSTTLGHSGSNACNSLSQKERDVAEATSMKQEAHIL
jgi:hypothetical protein